MRAAGIVAFCLFSSLLSTVTSLKCHKCVSILNECEGENVPVVECKEDEICSTLVFNTSIPVNGSLSLTIKECLKRDHCADGFFSSTTVDDRHEVGRVQCCQTDVCNAKTLQLEPYEEFQPNSLKCPGCYTQHADFCEPNQSVTCVGDQDQCFTLGSTTEAYGNRTGKISFQGCATKDTCSYPLGEFLRADGFIKFNITTVECRNATSNPEI